MIRYKIHTNVPQTHTEKVRLAMGDAGAGVIGNYHYCAFVIPGIGYFKPVSGADPYTGTVGQIESVVEDRLEYVCNEDCLPAVIDALRTSHPYEEPPIEIYKLENL